MSKLKSRRVIPAVGYLRKSTKKAGHEKSIADQEARISKLQPPVEGARYEIVRLYTDPGVQGWKRGHKRPGYFQLVNDLEERRDVEAVLVDDMDRFSRADSMRTIADVQQLRELGVRYIHAVNQGPKDLDQDWVTHQIAADANASHAFSTRLSRRITEARRDRARAGKRTGGPVPYALEPDGFEFREDGKRKVATTLKPGDPAEVAVVRELFDRFANRLDSLNKIAGDLNERKVPAPISSKWYAKTIGTLIRQRAYRGDFRFGGVHRGQFHGLDAKGEVRSTADLDRKVPGKVYETAKVYEPVVDPDLWDRANRRLDSLAGDRSLRKRTGYALTGILVCDHCGLPMFGVRQHRGSGKRSPTVYRCNSPAIHGRGACRQYQVREDKILPFLLRLLGEELESLLTLDTNPPEALLPGNKTLTAHRAKLERERKKLNAKIEKAMIARIESEDQRTRQEYDRLISGWRDELDRIDADLAAGPQEGDRTREQIADLNTWWEAFNKDAVSVPVSAETEYGSGGRADARPLLGGVGDPGLPPQGQRRLKATRL